MVFLGVNAINNLVINMDCLLFATLTLFGILCNTFTSAESDYLDKLPDKIDDDVDGEKFIKNLVNGESKFTDIFFIGLL